MPIPLSALQIADDIRDRIQMGEYPPGSQLPTYRHFMRIYGVGYTTIATVMLIMRERRDVIGVPGRGVFVPEEEDD